MFAVLERMDLRWALTWLQRATHFATRETPALTTYYLECVLYSHWAVELAYLLIRDSSLEVQVAHRWLEPGVLSL